jgi:hypothetical protein
MAANVVRELFRKTLLAVALLVSCFIAGMPVWAAGRTQAEADKYPYYVEFRAAVDGVYGHSYIAYGRLNSLGETGTAVYADIHPIGGFTRMVLGHFFALAASTTPEKDTLGHKIASRFRLPLTAQEYRRLRSIIARIRADRHTWSILAYNCNDFVADVARGMGMRTPTTLSLPYAFIPMLRARNEDMIHPMSMPVTGRLAEIQ